MRSAVPRNSDPGRLTKAVMKAGTSSRVRRGSCAGLKASDRRRVGRSSGSHVLPQKLEPVADGLVFIFSQYARSPLCFVVSLTIGPIDTRDFEAETCDRDARVTPSLQRGKRRQLFTDRGKQPFQSAEASLGVHYMRRRRGGAYAPPLPNFQTGMPSFRALSARFS